MVTKISVEEKAAIEDAKAEVETALKSDDVGKIKTVVGNLTNASMKLGEAVYKQAQQEQAQPESKESTELTHRQGCRRRVPRSSKRKTTTKIIIDRSFLVVVVLPTC